MILGLNPSGNCASSAGRTRAQLQLLRETFKLYVGKEGSQVEMSGQETQNRDYKCSPIHLTSVVALAKSLLNVCAQS